MFSANIRSQGRLARWPSLLSLHLHVQRGPCQAALSGVVTRHCHPPYHHLNTAPAAFFKPQVEPVSVSRAGLRRRGEGLHLGCGYVAMNPVPYRSQILALRRIDLIIYCGNGPVQKTGMRSTVATKALAIHSSIESEMETIK